MLGIPTSKYIKTSKETSITTTNTVGSAVTKPSTGLR